MAKLIERIGSQTTVDGKPIDLSKLVSMGTEIIHVREHGGLKERARQQAITSAIELAREYGCEYVLVGQQFPHLMADWQEKDWLLIASFYNQK